MRVLGELRGAPGSCTRIDIPNTKFTGGVSILVKHLVTSLYIPSHFDCPFKRKGCLSCEDRHRELKMSGRRDGTGETVVVVAVDRGMEGAKEGWPGHTRACKELRPIATARRSAKSMGRSTPRILARGAWRWLCRNAAVIGSRSGAGTGRGVSADVTRGICTCWCVA